MSDPTWIELSLFLGLGAWVSGLVNLLMNLRFVHTLGEVDSLSIGEPAPRLSILVPARDEEESVHDAVDSYCRQDYPDFEVIVVDDRSSDGTGAILAELSKRYENLMVVEGTDPADGWLGKAAALQRAQELAAAGEYRLACHLVEMAVAAEPDQREAHGARAEIYAERRRRESSLMAKGIYGFAARESEARAR